MSLRHRGRQSCTAVLIALGCGMAAAADADPKQAPLWEFGLGIGALGFADYRGADTHSVYPVPVPYFIYRGRFIKADRNGVRGLFLNRDWVEVNLSVGATTPVRSSNRGARSGMPSLRPTLEIGPSLDFHLWQSANDKLKFDFRVPMRSAVTVEASPRSIGWFLAPAFNLDMTDPGGHEGWNLGFLAGPLFADHRYHAYFYSVARPFATVGRPEYEARGGYSGTQFIASASKRFPTCWVGGFIRYDTLAGASFSDSPLVKTKSYWTAGLGIAWMIGKSSRLVDNLD